MWEVLVNYIKQYGEFFEVIFLFDNSELDYTYEKNCFPDKFILLGGDGNCGLPYAFNNIIHHPRCSSIDYLCTLDQDSLFSGKDIYALMQFIESVKENNNIGVVGPYIDYGFGIPHRKEQFKSVKWVITSGAFVNLNVLRRENILYDEKYFIDKFEIDLCRQISKKDYLILMYYGSILHQNLGEYSGHKHSNHSPERHYYLFRNRFYFNKKWILPGKRFFKNFFQTIRHIFLILAFENEKIIKMKMLFKAVDDYLQNRMGKLQDKCLH